MAEGLFRKAVEKRGDFEVASAGVSAHRGDPTARDTARLLDGRGIKLGNSGSQPVTKALVESSTHIFAMTSGHLEILESMFPDYTDKFYLTCEFVDLPGKGVGADVPDPIGMGRKAYEETAKTLDQAIPTLIAFIDQTWQGDSK
ncbi:MAG: protein tyrosine phosphatase [Akkermansiaceae bacterium]|nr:protein tyrosine phosphatase [Akkermansiaceae bacterium]